MSLPRRDCPICEDGCAFCSFTCRVLDARAPETWTVAASAVRPLLARLEDRRDEALRLRDGYWRSRYDDRIDLGDALDTYADQLAAAIEAWSAAVTVAPVALRPSTCRLVSRWHAADAADLRGRAGQQREWAAQDEWGREGRLWVAEEYERQAEAHEAAARRWREVA